MSVLLIKQERKITKSHVARESCSKYLEETNPLLNRDQIYTSQIIDGVAGQLRQPPVGTRDQTDKQTDKQTDRQTEDREKERETGFSMCR